MKRCFDIGVALFTGLVLLVPGLLIAIAVKATSPGPALYWSQRVGQHNELFRMPKFRSMFVEAPTLATHLLADSSRWITPLGRFLRITSLDELPQLWSVLRGDMSLVGPRPALFNQYDLIAQRTERGVHVLRPGITGWAQINGRDDLANPDKVRLDVYYLHNRSLAFDLKILMRTAVKVFRREGIAH